MSIHEQASATKKQVLFNIPLQMIDVAISGPICQLTLTRPESLNAFNQQMRQELVDVLTLINEDQQIKTVVLLAQGNCFSAGADLSELANECDNLEAQLLEEYAPIFHSIRRSDKIFIAGVNGVAAGIGAALAMSCDLLVMADDAQLYPAFMLLGLVPDGGTSWQFVKRLGYRKALEVCLEAKAIRANDCLGFGLTNKVVEPEQLQPAVNAWATKLAQGPLPAQRHLKQLLQKVDQMTFEDAFVAEAQWQQQCFTSRDFNEGLRAFFEKRQPNFSGK